jgi:hypothetical protein
MHASLALSTTTVPNTLPTQSSAHRGTSVQQVRLKPKLIPVQRRLMVVLIRSMIRTTVLLALRVIRVPLAASFQSPAALVPTSPRQEPPLPLLAPTALLAQSVPSMGHDIQRLPFIVAMVTPVLLGLSGSTRLLVQLANTRTISPSPRRLSASHAQRDMHVHRELVCWWVRLEVTLSPTQRWHVQLVIGVLRAQLRQQRSPALLGHTVQPPITTKRLIVSLVLLVSTALEVELYLMDQQLQAITARSGQAPRRPNRAQQVPISQSLEHEQEETASCVHLVNTAQLHLPQPHRVLQEPTGVHLASKQRSQVGAL